MQAMAGTMWALGAANKAPSGNGLLNNLVAYWGLDESAGANNALDKHSNGLTLTQAGSPGSAAGLVYAGARTFNGSSQLFTRASAAALQMGDVDFAISAWVYINAKGSYNHIVSKWSANQGEYLLRYQGGATDKYHFEVRNAANTSYVNVQATTFGAPPTGQWTLVIAQHDSINDNISIQINNGVINTQALVGGIYAGIEALSIGSQIAAATFTWNGRMGPVKVWKGRTLDAAARTALYNAGAGLAYTSFTA